MSNCRQIFAEMDVSPGLLETLVLDIERAVENNSNAVFCLSYSLIDTACKTILDKRGVEDRQRDNLPQRFKVVLKELNLLPPDYDTGPNEGIRRILRGLEQALQGLCELRNGEGIYSHGKIASKKNLEALQIRFAAATADTIVNYIYQAHLAYPAPNQELQYDEYKDFNDTVDEIHGAIEIVGLTFLPSWVLYSADKDHTAYREALLEHQLSKQVDAGSA